MIRNVLEELSRSVRLKQYLLAGGVACILVILVTVLLSALFTTHPSPNVKPSPPLQTVGESLEKEYLWKEKIQQDHESLRIEMGELIESISQHTADVSHEHQAQRDLIERRLQGIETQVEAYFDDVETFDHGGESQVHLTASEPMEDMAIHRVSLNLHKSSPRTKKQKISIDTTIPAGTFAKAVLLSGLDASTSLSASADPRPVLLRIVDMAQLPRSFRSDVKDCHCIASAYGDLSSERVYMRLENLTCVERLTGEIVETEVAGYIAGRDGRVGVRGVVVSKDGAYLARGLYTGLLGGISNVANPSQQQSFSVTSGGVLQTDPLSTDKLFLSGLGQGASKALDRLADYNISRAEQLQPVIQIPAGQEIDIVFTKGAFIGGSTVKEEITKVRDQARDDVSSQASWEELTRGPQIMGDQL